MWLPPQFVDEGCLCAYIPKLHFEAWWISSDSYVEGDSFENADLIDNDFYAVKVMGNPSPYPVEVALQFWERDDPTLDHLMVEVTAEWPGVVEAEASSNTFVVTD